MKKKIFCEKIIVYPYNYEFAPILRGMLNDGIPCDSIHLVAPKAWGLCNQEMCIRDSACAFPVWLLSLPGVFLWGRKIKKKRPTISRIIQICSMYFLIAFGVMYFLLIIGVIPTK